jgi:hypothetical protein
MNFFLMNKSRERVFLVSGLIALMFTLLFPLWEIRYGNDYPFPPEWLGTHFILSPPIPPPFAPELSLPSHVVIRWPEVIQQVIFLAFTTMMCVFLARKEKSSNNSKLPKSSAFAALSMPISFMYYSHELSIVGLLKDSFIFRAQGILPKFGALLYDLYIYIIVAVPFISILLGVEWIINKRLNRRIPTNT